jgi:hypothetical protein
MVVVSLLAPEDATYRQAGVPAALSNAQFRLPQPVRAFALVAVAVSRSVRMNGSYPQVGGEGSAITGTSASATRLRSARDAAEPGI